MNPEALKRIADALEHKNRLYEIEVLCKVADALKSIAKSTCGEVSYDMYDMASKIGMKLIDETQSLLKGETKI